MPNCSVNSPIDILFYFLVSDRNICQESILKLSLDHINTRKPRWKVKYLFHKLRYVSNRFKVIHGLRLYEELVGIILKQLENEEAKRLKKIDDGIRNFFKIS